MKSEIKKKSIVSPIVPRVQNKVPEIAIPVKKNENIFIFITLSIYVVIGLVGVFHHDPWRDEVGPWLFSSLRSSFIDFFNKLSFEPFMWGFIEFIISRFTDSPLIAQVIYFLISA